MSQSDDELRQKIEPQVYPEFANFLQDCHDGKSATYRATDSDQVIYNKQAVVALLEGVRGKQQHGSTCIDDECMDEGHVYWYVPVEVIDDKIKELEK